jgi:hypothetical protein
MLSTPTKILAMVFKTRKEPKVEAGKDEDT